MGGKIVDTFGEGEEMSECLICVYEDIFHDRFLFVEFMCGGDWGGGRLVCGPESIEFGIQRSKVG